MLIRLWNLAPVSIISNYQSNLFSIRTFHTINSFYVMIWYTYNRWWRQFAVCIFIMSAKYYNGRNWKIFYKMIPFWITGPEVMFKTWEISCFRLKVFVSWHIGQIIRVWIWRDHKIDFRLTYTGKSLSCIYVSFWILLTRDETMPIYWNNEGLDR